MRFLHMTCVVVCELPASLECLPGLRKKIRYGSVVVFGGGGGYHLEDFLFLLELVLEMGVNAGTTAGTIAGNGITAVTTAGMGRHCWNYGFRVVSSGP